MSSEGSLLMVSEQLDKPSLRFFKSFGLRLLKKLCSRSCIDASYFASSTTLQDAQRTHMFKSLAKQP